MEPSVPIPLSWLFAFLQVLTVGIGGWVIKTTREIRDELRTLNGRVIRLEQWQHDHDVVDAATRGQVESLRMTLMERD